MRNFDLIPIFFPQSIEMFRSCSQDSVNNAKSSKELEAKIENTFKSKCGRGKDKVSSADYIGVHSTFLNKVTAICVCFFGYL